MSTHSSSTCRLRTTSFSGLFSVALMIAPAGFMTAQIPQAQYLDAATAAEVNAPMLPVAKSAELKRDALNPANSGPFGMNAPGFGDAPVGGPTIGGSPIEFATTERPGTMSIREAAREPSGKEKKTIVKAEEKLARGEVEAAFALLRGAMEGAARPYALSLMGQEHLRRAFQDRSQLPAALNELNEAAATRPNDGPLHGNLAVALLLNGQNELARKEAEAALRVDPAQPKTRYILGRALVNLGRTEEASYHLRMAAPDLQVAKDLLATLPKQGAVKEANTLRAAH